MNKIFFLFLFVPCLVFAHPLESLWPDAPITLPKGDGTISVEESYKQSNDFYDADGHLKDSADSSSPTSGHEDYYDVVSALSATYGLTDNWSIWLSLPIVFRTRSTATSSTDNWGLGDTEAGARYRFYYTEDRFFESAAELHARFPSGSTAGSFGPPLGTGDARISPSLYAKLHPTEGVGVELSTEYTYRREARVEYLYTTSVLQASDDGSTSASLPLGNSNIEWGDEFHTRSALGWKFADWIAVSGGVDYVYRWPTYIHSFLLTVSGTTLTSTPLTYKSSSSWLLTGSPSLLLSPTENFTIGFTVDFPIRGESYPILPTAESLVGRKYRLELRYAF